MKANNSKNKRLVILRYMVLVLNHRRELYGYPVDSKRIASICLQFYTSNNKA